MASMNEERHTFCIRNDGGVGVDDVAKVVVFMWDDEQLTYRDI
jgi:hypothetical protein